MEADRISWVWMLLPFVVVLAFYFAAPRVAAGIAPCRDAVLADRIITTGVWVLFPAAAYVYILIDAGQTVELNIETSWPILLFFGMVCWFLGARWRLVSTLLDRGRAVEAQLSWTKRNLIGRPVSRAKSRFSYEWLGTEYQQTDRHRLDEVPANPPATVEVVIDPDNPSRAMLAVNLRKHA